MRLEAVPEPLRPRRPVPAGSRTARPPEVDSLLDLQRRIGNRAVAELVRPPAVALQRFTVTNNYVPAAVAPGTDLFRTQALDAATRRYRRQRINSGLGGLTAITEEYDPAANTWNQVAAQAVAQPAIRLSENEQFAIRNAGGNSQVAYMDATEVAAANVRLAGQGANVRLQSLAGALTTNAGAQLEQVTAIIPANLQGAVRPALGALNRAHQRWANVVCHNFAQYAAPTTVAAPGGARSPGSKKGEKAAPSPGQKYFFQAPNDDVLVLKTSDFNKALNKLATIDGLLATVGLDRSVGEVVEQNGIGGLGSFRGMLPGWADHSEAVISKDGPDTLTFANYNRLMEYSGMFGVHVRNLARADVNFKNALLQLRATHAAALGNAGKAFANTDIRSMIGSAVLRPLLLNEIANYDNALSQELAALYTARGLIQAELFYFDMYGAGKLSFHTRYRYAGGRGKKGTTTVHGTAS
jgi:hypothetical protein